MPPCPVARSTSSRIRFLSSALNLRRCAFSGTSGSGELATRGTAILASLTMILLATPLCNYGRGFCLIDVGTEGGENAIGNALVHSFLNNQATEQLGVLSVGVGSRR